MFCAECFFIVQTKILFLRFGPLQKIYYHNCKIRPFFFSKLGDKEDFSLRAYQMRVFNEPLNFTYQWLKQKL
jgi:hypothetical protein